MIELGQQVEARPQSRVSKLRRWLPLTLLGLDVVLTYLAFVVAYWTRYSLKIGPPIHDQLAFSAYQPLGLLLLSILLPVLLFKGAYRTNLSTEMADEIGTIFSAGTITVAAIVVVTAMLQQWQYSRGVILYLWVLLVALLALGRAGYRGVQALCYRKGWGVRRLLVVGATDVGKMVMQSVMNRPDLGYKLVGFVDQRNVTSVRNFGRFRALGTVADIPELVESNLVDEIIVALPASAHEEVTPVLLLCEQHGVGLKLVPDLFEMNLGRVRIDEIAGIPLLDVRDKPLRRLARAWKRLVDVVAASIVTVVSLPFIAVLAVLIRMESDGPALLRQTRIGIGGKPFTCFKLRTMRPDAQELQPELQVLNETDGPLFKLRDDPRCTPLGRRIRRWSLDELPQIWNVLRGDMSLVGPRPPLPSEVEQYEPRHMRRLEVKPGMTGIWQVSGRSHLPFDEMVLMDMYYVDNWSPALDIRILIRTIIAVLTRRGAY